MSQPHDDTTHGDRPADVRDPGAGSRADGETGAAEEAGPKRPASFEAALEELEEIVEAVSEDRIPIDELGSKVARGAELVAICRQQLAATQAEVTRVTEELARLAHRDQAADTGPATGEEPVDAPAAPPPDRDPDDVPF